VKRIRVYEIGEGKGPICNRILRSLPDWFGIEASIVNYVKEVETLPFLVADFKNEQQIGFLSLVFHNENNAGIHVMGVLPEFHRQGVGSALVEAAVCIAKQRGCRFMTVKTLSPSMPDRHYDLTRKFYPSVGFVPLEELKTFWGEHNPCLLMIRTV
jgi:GNAT superfamily N-acetyltransferase